MSSQNSLDSLSRLFQARYGLVIGVARRYAPTQDQVDDIVQQVYCEFVEGALKEKWDLTKDVAPLLYRIAKTKGLLLWRQRRQRKNSSLDLISEELLAYSGLTEQDEWDEYQRNEDRILALKHCLEMLSPKSRAFVEQHYFEGVSMKKIAEEQSSGDSAVRHFFCRIRSKLKECIVQKTSHRKTEES